ncbi:hypothetical protein [Blastococcus sp. PRF04-17]|uniref:hypothetical protein n=1 Tax=Blastococcus sp. PRF04-17 TaxID=2933797 RepID=UPI001FF309D8|nr:hypothetical protein [Blastococcus sp. PRF04-17]UOY01692.1 hypothetical protein MVA48_22685 [Blastococcus sp. PRF04-17]
MDVHPVLIAQLAEQRRADLLRQAGLARRGRAPGRTSLTASWGAALTRAVARLYRAGPTPVCCPA